MVGTLTEQADDIDELSDFQGVTRDYYQQVATTHSHLWCQEMFTKIDSDGSNTITKEEVGAVCVVMSTTRSGLNGML